MWVFTLPNCLRQMWAHYRSRLLFYGCIIRSLNHRIYSRWNKEICPEQYKDVDPRHGSLLSDKFCFVLSENAKLTIDKDHAYYNQIQHQLADEMSLCDFVVYTLKGAAIDRVCFGIDHWRELCDKICTFYFKHYLPILPITA